MTAFPGGRRGALALLLLLVFAFALQGSRALYAPDEGRYTDVALQMVESGDWLHPQLAPGVPHYTKPPLTYWAVAAALRLGGENTWAARAPNALAFVGAVLMVWRLGRRFVPEQPWQPALIYAAFAFPYLAANLVTTDTLLAACETLAMLGFVEAWWADDAARRQRWILLMALGAGLAFLAKGPPGLLPLGAAALWAWRSEGRAGLARLASWRALALFLGVALFWYLAVALDTPDLLRYFLVEEVWGRVAGSEMHRHEQWYGGFVVYLPTLLVGTLPWTPWLLRGLWRALRDRAGLRVRWQTDAELRLLLCWLGLPLAVFFVARSRLPLYLLPLFVPLALLAARELGPLDLARTRTRLALALWAAVLLAARAAPLFVDSELDEARLARAVYAAAPAPPSELAFVEVAPRYGLRLYGPAEVRRLNIPNGPPETQSEALVDALHRDERCRLYLVDPHDRAEIEAYFARLDRGFRLLGDVRGYRLYRLDDGGCGEPTHARAGSGH